MEHDASRGIVVVDCATHASCVTDDAIRRLLLPLDTLLQ